MTLRQNIIYIYFKGKHQVTSKSQYQYNHGQYLYFADLNLPQVFEVHFSNKNRGESKTQIGSDKLVEIPDEYFWSGALEIYVWVYLHSGTDDGETIYEVKIPLIKRAKPTDEEPLPVQQSAIDKAIAELNNAVDVTNENADKTNADKTQVATIKEEVVTLKEEIDSTASAVSQDAQSARESADASEQSAQNSAESERKALDYSDEAKGYAQSALESKDTASQKAQIATDASAEAKGYRDEAETFKNEAEQAKQNIVDYRDETKGYRDETLNLKNTVQTLKNQADETAEEIKDISDTVKEDAQSASQSASSASQSSINASQFASQAGKSANDAEESANQAEQNKSQTEIFKNQSEEYKTQAGAFKSQTETFKNQAEEFKNQTETNVTHYPKIIGEYWYVWDATNGEYINTNVDANGIKGDTGNGIASVALNDDYTLTITFTDDTTYTTSSIRGQQGEKGDTGKTGESGVYIGTEEPENEDIKVWIDTDESADSGTVEDLIEEVNHLKEGLKSCGIQSKVIRNAYPDSSGVITAGSWDTYCYRVASGQKINSIELASTSQQLIFAYYADEPAIDSVSYNNSRIPMGSGIVTAKNIFVPKSDSINWIAIRCATSDKPVVEFENVGDVNNAILFRGATGITDINSIRDTSVRYISSGNTSNLPANGAWYLMSMRHDSNNHLQLAYKAQGTETYIRAMVAGTWGAWQSIGSEIVSALESKSFTRNSNSGITDANSITNIGYSYLSANSVSNLPDSGAWYVWTVSLDGSNLMQLAYNARGTNPYIRAKVSGTWGAWERIGKESVDELAVTSSIAMFPSVGCCGDSFTAGYLYNKTDSQWYDPNYVPNGEYPAIGYPAVMGRLYGVDVTAFAKGGLTTTAYRTDTKGLPAILNDTAKDLYIIALGLNDKTQEIPIGVEADIDTEPASATYLGNMGAIIRAIQTHAPYSRIILCKSLWMNNNYYSYISNGVELLSSHLGIPYIETLGDPYFASSAYKDGLKGLHPTAPLYAGMGKRIGELVGKCVIDNPTYFYNFYVPNT